MTNKGSLNILGQVLRSALLKSGSVSHHLHICMKIYWSDANNVNVNYFESAFYNFALRGWNLSNMMILISGITKILKKKKLNLCSKRPHWKKTVEMNNIPVEVLKNSVCTSSQNTFFKTFSLPCGTNNLA